MSDSITAFFEAWQVDDADLRFEKLTGSVSEDISYDDPRTPETVNGISALNNYVGLFTKNAPGWSAKVIKSDTVAGVTRVTVAFEGAAPDGSEQVQLGQYYVEKDQGLVSRVVGFVGTGEPG